jgi:serine/threonine-protein kinase PknG
MTMTQARCQQPGCTGTIQDGYCDVCGIAAPPPGLQAQPSRQAPGSGGTGTGTGTGTGGSASAGTATGSRGSAGSRRTRSGSTRSGGSRASRGSLGAGLIEIPPVPARDPATAVLANPQVPENKRFCGSCEQPVGRGRDGRPGLTEGFCPRCGTPFSFSPKLARGELVAGQYEVLGCLAHGGLGWLYLAMDRNLGNRWVVLKGLLNSGDAAAIEAAVAERRFLAEVEHPSIVGVYNFVQHADRATGEQAGYIVMEYVGGESLRQLLQQWRRSGQSLPLPMALAYMIEILPALGYLHSRGLVYCDFKPDNVIQTEEQLKLIDMGGVRRIDDEEGAIYGTVGYQAPEIADDGPSPSSDLYTVGRALAVLTFEFAGYQSTYKNSLPDPAGIPLLASQESFTRTLRRATHADPDRRFGSAAEMAEQLTGVLREVLAVADGSPRPAFSALFSPELQAVGVPPVHAEEGQGAAHGTLARQLPPPGLAEIAAGLPVPRVDPADPAAGYLATLGTLEPAQLVAVLASAVTGGQGTPAAVAQSPETQLALARAQIIAGDLNSARAVLAKLESEDPGDWRVGWYRGLVEITGGNAGDAAAAFNAVYDELPGELAPKLALAFAAERAGDLETAARHFGLVWAIDRSYVSAAFGLARDRLLVGDRAAAIAVLCDVPATSSYYLAAQLAAVRIRVYPARGQACVSANDLADAGRGLARLRLDAITLQQVTAEVLRAALGRVQAREPLDGELLGCGTTERALRFGLERSYRAQAQLVSDRHSKIALVDLANDVRPRTWS